MLTILKEILNNILYALGLREMPKASAPRPRPGPTPDTGVNGVLDVEALLARDKDRDKLILVVDSDLKDVPVWVDWEVNQGVVGIAQQGGAYATVMMKIDAGLRDELKGLKRLLIVTKTGTMNVVHHVPFIVKDY